MKPDDILTALHDFTEREVIEFFPLASGTRAVSAYAPIEKYLLDLKNTSKPETAAEELFGALCRDVLELQPTRQVAVTSGYVDFMLPERMGNPLPLELKPLFHVGKGDTIVRDDVDPAKHDAQVRKYLRDHEYLILTDLRTAWFFNARG